MAAEFYGTGPSLIITGGFRAWEERGKGMMQIPDTTRYQVLRIEKFTGDS